MRKTLAVIAIASALLLGGCAGSPPEGDTSSDEGTAPGESTSEESFSEGDVVWIEKSQDIWELQVTLEDGRKVVCVVWDNGGGISCLDEKVAEDE